MGTLSVRLKFVGHTQHAEKNMRTLGMRLKVHKHEIVFNFFLPKSNPYMPFVNFREKKLASFPSIFARISMFEHFRGD
jgi:hypothetical protein